MKSLGLIPKLFSSAWRRLRLQGAKLGGEM